MRGFSAREMLSQLPLRMAHGGDVLFSSLLRLANGGNVSSSPSLLRMANGGDATDRSALIQNYVRDTFGDPPYTQEQALEFSRVALENNVSAAEVSSALNIPEEVVSNLYSQVADTTTAATTAATTTAAPTLPPGEHSVSYNRAFELNGEAGVQAYYQGLRNAAQTYLADADSVAGAEAYNLMIESGISTTDLINAGVGEAVLDRVFNLTEDPTIDTFPLTNAESAFLRDPILLAEAARRSAAGEDGVASLQQQARDYVAGVLEGGITEAERIEMQRIATTRGHTAQDFEATGVDAGILFEGTYCPPGSELEGQPMPADMNCNPGVTPPTTKVCPTGTALAGQTIPIADDCDATTPTTKVCPPGSKREGETVLMHEDCDATTATTKVCPTGTAREGETIPIADDCDATIATTKVCPAGTAREGETIPIADDCDATIATTKVCPAGTALAGQTIPIMADCNASPATTKVCPTGSVRAGQTVAIDADCDPTTKVCPAGTKLAGDTVAYDATCDPAAGTTKLCPVGTRRSGETIAIDEDCDPTTKMCPHNTRLAGQTIGIDENCDPPTKLCPSGTKLAGQTVAYDANCDPTTKMCPAGTKKYGQTIPFNDDCNEVDIIYCPPETRLGGQPVPPDGDCNPPLRCPEGSELAGLPIPADQECNPSSVPVYCDAGTELEGQLMPANGDCNPTKFTETKLCPAGSELAGQTIATENSCDPSTVTTAPTVYGTTKVCPTGTARAGETIPIDDDCGAALPTTKVCPPGTKLANQTIGIADDCEGPGIYPADTPAVDTTFRESAPRTQATYEETQADGTVVTKDLPGQYTYTPAAKLLPATGSGLSWMPPSVTSRPRSLLSPGAIQQYGGMTSASSRFAQNRRGMDRTILQAFRTADLYDPNAIRDFRQQARAGLFSTDDGAFSPAQFQSAFDTYLSLRPVTKVCPAGTARAGQTVAESVDCDVAAAAGQGSGSSWGGYSGKPWGPSWGPFGDSEPGAGEAGGFTNPTGDDTGYFGPITPVDLRYGVPGQFFAKGGPVRKPVKSKPARGMSARNMLAQFANGGSVSADRIPLAETDPLYIHEDPRPMETESALMLRVLDTPAMGATQKKNAARGAPAPDESESLRAHQPRNTDQTESASMLESIMEGASMIPETVANYFVRPNEAGGPSLVSPRQVGSDIKWLGGTVYEGAKAEPLRFAMDILPVIGELVSAHDVGKFTDMANEAEAEGKPALADMFRQIVTLSAAGAVPLAGMGARVTKRSVISAAKKAAEEATTTSARMLDDVVVAGATSPLRMLDEVVEETAKWMGPGWRWTLKRAEGTDIPYIRANTIVGNDFAEQIRVRTPEPTNNNGYMGADVNTRVVGDSVAETFNRQIADDPMGMIELYKKIESTEGGKVHDTDAFRELSSNYLADRSLSPSVHEPASALNKTYYAMKLEETQGEPGRWLFTGGGPGSGKSSGPAGPMRDSADLVFDGTLAKFDTNVSRIDDALKSGKTAQIAFVDMAPEKAIRRAVMRAMNQVEKFGSGRTIPIDHFVQMHVDSRKTIKQLVERYKGNEAVDINLINNNGGPNDAARLSEGFTIDQIADLDYDETVRRVTAVLEEMKLEGEGVISDDIYRGFTKNTSTDAYGNTRLDDTSPTTTPTLDTRRASSQGGNGQSVPRDAGQLGRERSQVQASTVEPIPIETTTAASTSARGAL